MGALVKNHDMGAHKYHFNKVILVSTHNLGFCEEITIIIFPFSLKVEVIYSLYFASGHPMKLIYFVSPYDLLCKKTKSSYPMTHEGKQSICPTSLSSVRSILSFGTSFS